MVAIVDCNSFYCSCERLFRPELDKQPVVVLSNNDGCIVSRTDEAKALCIGMAAPYFQNKDLILRHQVAVFSSNYHLYGDLSMRVMDTMRQLVPPQCVEVYSVDEAFVDVRHIPSTILDSFSMHLKQTVEQWTGIKVSVGVAPTKVLSKVANRLSKKNKVASQGVMVLHTNEDIKKALQATPVGDVWGVGGRSAVKLKEMGIFDAWQLANLNEGWAGKNLGGVVGVRLLRELRGEPCIDMKDPLETKKMIATTRMFGHNVTNVGDIKEAVATYTARAAEKLRRQASVARCIQVFVVSKHEGLANDPHFRHGPTTAMHSILSHHTSNTKHFIKAAMQLVEQVFVPGKVYKKAGVLLSDIVPETAIQTNLFANNENKQEKKLMQIIDNINFSQRNDVLKFAGSGTRRDWKMRQELRSQRFSTRWEELCVVH
jgi:DNA polymerase V